MPRATEIVRFTYTRTPQSRKLSRTSDGDTPVIEQPIRMVSCDTPEKASYAGKPEKSQPKLDECRERLQSAYYSTLPQGLRTYLIRKLTADAANRHLKAAEEASRVFDTLLDQRLIRPDGRRRNLAVLPTGEVIDRYGRLLAYLAPWFANTATDPLPPRHDPERRTFNLNMIKSGWAAFFPVYPSLPPQEDWDLTVKAAEKAWTEKRGAWKAHGRNLLLGYEYRMCIKLGTAKSAKDGIAEAFQRICVDLRNRRILGKYDFYKLDPPYRLWVWEEHLEQAKADLELTG